MSRLVIDAPVHPQRFTPGFLKGGEQFTYDKLENAIMSELPFDNSRALLVDMDRLGIDKACVLTAFALRNEMIHEQMQRYPDRFIGFGSPAREAPPTEQHPQPSRAIGTPIFRIGHAFSRSEGYTSKPSPSSRGKLSTVASSSRK